MLGGKRRATTLEEMASAISLKRTLAPQRILQTLDRHQAVQRRLAGKESRLAPMLVVLRVAQQPHPGSGADERCHASIRECLVVAHRRWILRKVLAELPVRHKKPCGNSAERHQPIHIGKSHVPRTRPDLFLVQKEILPQSCHATTRCRCWLRVNIQNPSTVQFFRLLPLPLFSGFLHGGAVTLPLQLLCLSGTESEARQTQTSDRPSAHEQNGPHPHRTYSPLTDGCRRL